MAAPTVIIPMLEGMVGTMPTTASQRAAEWVRSVKELLKLPQYRDYTDWEFEASPDVDETGNVVRSGASTVYAVLVSTNAADAERDWFVITDNTSNTFDGTAALDNDDLVAFQPPAAATDNVEELHGLIFHQGLPCPTGITLSADGRDGANPATDDLRAFILYRTA